MSDIEHVFVFSYDIEKDSARNRVSAILEECLRRVQKSVFEGRMTQNQARRLAEQLRPWIAPKDNLRVYCLTAEGLAASVAIGVPPLPEETHFLLL
jgi:CRISPR-associated protein Cas2